MIAVFLMQMQCAKTIISTYIWIIYAKPVDTVPRHTECIKSQLQLFSCGATDYDADDTTIVR